MKIETRGITRTFGYYPALEDVDITVPSGELVALLGPSGSGKTTLLRVIAGLEVPQRGHITFGDADVSDLPVRKRNVGFVFQHYALFPHMTVARNIAFGLTVRRYPRKKIADRVSELVSLMHLDGLAGRLPHELSGGQRQRVALARALAPEPKVLLLDEPFGALDARVRKDLRKWLRHLHDQIHVTTVFVTHDQEEAFEVADRVVILNEGRVEQCGTPDEIFDSPASAFVMDFIGSVNILQGHMDPAGSHFGDLVLPDSAPGTAPMAVRAYIRRQDITLATTPNGAPHLHGTITYARRVGLVTHTLVQPGDHMDPLEVELPHDDWEALGFKVGSRVVASVKRAQVFKAPRAAS